MASETMSISEAAAYLKVSDRTIRTYIKNGLLSATRNGRSRQLRPTEVEELRIDLQGNGVRSLLSRKELLQLRAEVRRLSSQMEVVLRILDSKSDPLSITEGYARDLHGLCLSQLSTTSWSATEISPWLEIFMRIDERDFEVMEAATADPKPWLPFLRLCVAMTARVVSMEDYSTSISLQSLHKQLAEARRRLRVAALIFSESRGLSDADLKRYGFAEAAVSTRDVLESVLRRKK
tara:strand:- start:617 stop:1321 length:705 start_codon:yes stop_codon:yes gene_type:complete